MYWILLVMGMVVAAIVALVVGGLITPRLHVVTRAATLRAAPDAVWALIRDVERYAEWRANVRRVERVAEDDGVLRWREMGKHGSVTYENTIDDAPHRFGSRIVDEDLPYSGEWNWVLTPAGDGTHLAITERGEVGNPVFRFLSAHVFGHTRMLDEYLRDLAKRCGESEPTIAER